MEFGGIGLILGLGVLVLAGIALVVTRLRGGAAPPTGTVVREPAPRAEPPRLRDRLTALYQAGDWPELLRVLDRTMPE